MNRGRKADRVRFAEVAAIAEDDQALGAERLLRSADRLRCERRELRHRLRQILRRRIEIDDARAERDAIARPELQAGERLDRQTRYDDTVVADVADRAAGTH